MPGFRSLISSDSITDDDLNFLFARASDIKAGKPLKPSKQLNASAVLAFFEPSTRTQFSFERALQNLSWPYSVLQPERSSTLKGESLRDTFENLAAHGFSIAIVRHPQSDVFRQLVLGEERIKMHFISAGSGHCEHPTQGLLDVFTLKELLGELKGKQLTVVGDALHSRAAHSTGRLAKHLGMHVVFCGPPFWVHREWAEEGFEVSFDLTSALAKADAVMALRPQEERHRGAFKLPAEFRISRERLEALTKQPVLLAPGPVKWGVELDQDVRAYAKQHILLQAENSVPIRQAVLEWCLS